MLAGYVAVLQTAPDGATFSTVPGIDQSVQLSLKVDNVDALSLGGGGGQRKIYTLKNYQCKVSGQYNDANTAQLNFLKNEGNRCDVDAFYADGSDVKFQGIVESYDFDCAVNAVTKFGATILQNAAEVFTNSGDTLPVNTPLNTPFASYGALVQMPGVTTIFAQEATSLISGKTYQITNAAHRWLDPTLVPVIKDNGATVADANIASIDYMFGKVTFVSTYTPTTPITFDSVGGWINPITIATSKAFKFTVKNKLLESANFDSGGIKTYIKGPKQASGSFTTLSTVLVDQNPSNNIRLVNAVNNRANLGLVFNVAGAATQTFRCWAVVSSEDLKYPASNIQEATINFESTALARGRDEANFSWGT